MQRGRRLVHRNSPPCPGFCHQDPLCRRGNKVLRRQGALPQSHVRTFPRNATDGTAETRAIRDIKPVRGMSEHVVNACNESLDPP